MKVSWAQVSGLGDPHETQAKHEETVYGIVLLLK